MTTYTTIFKGRFEPIQEKTYFHLPFDMPSNAVRLDVECHYSDRIGSDPRLAGGNTIDLGLFDQRGIEFLKAGFRGWSGSEKERFFITDKEATPGYIPGALEPGRWSVLFGLYKMASQGCDYEVAINITTQVQTEADVIQTHTSSRLSASPPINNFNSWYRGELHCHSWHSDGENSPESLVNMANAMGLDFLAVTDHNTSSSQRELDTIPDPGLVLVHGVEVTTFKGHFNAWGIKEWVDFRVTSPDDMRSVIDFARQMGALTSSAHPKPLGPDWDYPEVSTMDCVEVWNGPWTGLDEVSLNFWLERLATGRRIPAVGGSDFHRAGEITGFTERQLGRPTNWVYVPGVLTESGILDSLRSGHIVISEGPDGPFLELLGGEGFTARGGDIIEKKAGDYLPIKVHCRGGKGCAIKILDQSGVLITEQVTNDDTFFEYQLAVNTSLYLRVELRTDEDWMKAMTNPIYILNQS